MSKISELPSASDLDGTEQFAIVKDGSTQFATTQMVSSMGSSPVDDLYSKDFSYNDDGSLDTIVTSDTESGDSTQKKFNYNPDGTFLNITTTEVSNWHENTLMLYIIDYKTQHTLNVDSLGFVIEEPPMSGVKAGGE